MLFEISASYPPDIIFISFINQSGDGETVYYLGSLVIWLYTYISQKKSGKLSGHTQLHFHRTNIEAEYLLKSCDLMGTRIVFFIQIYLLACDNWQ